MKKNFTLLFLFLFSQFITFSQNANFVWAKGIHASNYQDGIGIISDPLGNVYSTGLFRGTVDFDPGVGVFNLTSPGVNNSIYIMKNDQFGNFVWAKSIGNSSIANSFQIILDQNNAVYVCGFFNGTMDFNPGPALFNITSNGTRDAFVLKLDNNGNFVWAKSWGATGSDEAKSIAIKNNNLYITGSFSDTVDFNPNVGVFNLVSHLNFSNFSTNTYVLNLDLSGNFINAFSFGSINETVKKINIDNGNNIIVSGIFRDSCDFDPSLSTYYLYAPPIEFSSFISKFDMNGNLIWARAFVGNDRIEIWDAVVDNDNNIYTTGGFENQGDFDPGTAVYTLTSNQVSFNNGYLDIFVSKLDSNGIFNWAKAIGGDKQDFGICITLDEKKNVYVGGTFEGWPNPIDFNPGSSVLNINSSTKDGFILKLNKNGAFQFVKTFWGSNAGAVNGIYLDAAKNIFTTGHYSGSNTDFDPNSGTQFLPFTDLSEIFISKLSQCQNADTTIIVNSCNPTYTYNNQTYTNSGIYTHLFVNSIGCDSIVTLQLNFNIPTSSSFNQNACDSFLWFNQNYTSSGIYTHTLVNSVGCDSIITLNLSINQATNSTINQNSCDSFSWFGQTYFNSGIYQHTIPNASNCDSNISLNLTINNSTNSTQNISNCGSYTWNGQSYSTSGTYVQTYQNAMGCDSIATLNLTVITIDPTVSYPTQTILKSNQNSATYQWLECLDQIPPTYNILSGETNQTLSNTQISKKYAVIVTLNGCIDTSSCYIINPNSLLEFSTIISSINPNPFNDIIKLNLNSHTENIDIQLTTILGQLILEKKDINTNEVIINIPQITDGIYILSIKSKTFYEKIKLIKK